MQWIEGDLQLRWEEILSPDIEKWEHDIANEKQTLWLVNQVLGIFVCLGKGHKGMTFFWGGGCVHILIVSNDREQKE